jgi:hypothetical protein
MEIYPTLVFGLFCKSRVRNNIFFSQLSHNSDMIFSINLGISSCLNFLLKKKKKKKKKKKNGYFLKSNKNFWKVKR